MRIIRFRSARDTDFDRVDEMTARFDAYDVRILSGACCIVPHQYPTKILPPNITGLIAAKILSDNMVITTNIGTRNVGKEGFGARPESIGPASEDARRHPTDLASIPAMKPAQ